MQYEKKILRYGAKLKKKYKSIACRKRIYGWVAKELKCTLDSARVRIYVESKRIGF